MIQQFERGLDDQQQSERSIPRTQGYEDEGPEEEVKEGHSEGSTKSNLI